MSSPTLSSRGVRLHPALWARIDSEAKDVRLKPTDYLRRKIETAFGFDPDVQDWPMNGHGGHEIQWSAINDDDEE